MYIGIVGHEAQKFTPEGEAEAKRIIRDLLAPQTDSATQDRAMTSLERFLHMEDNELPFVPSQEIDNFLTHAHSRMNSASIRVECFTTNKDAFEELTFWSAVASFCYQEWDRYQELSRFEP